MRAPDLDYVFENLRFAVQRVAQLSYRWNQLSFELLGRRDVHGGGEGVVRRLRQVDVIVGMDGLLAAECATRELDGAIGDHLVGIHVGLRAAAGLPDAQWKV